MPDYTSKSIFLPETFLFGQKEQFALELESMKTKHNYKLCFWVNGNRLGTFTRGGELLYAIEAYYLFTRHKEDFYLLEFSTMSPAQIDYYLREIILLVGSTKKDKIEEYKKRAKLCLSLGNQFDADGVHLLYHNDQVSFIYHPPFKGKVKAKIERYEVVYSVFCEVYSEFINFCFGSIEVLGEKGHALVTKWIQQDRKPFLLRS